MQQEHPISQIIALKKLLESFENKTPVQAKFIEALKNQNLDTKSRKRELVYQRFYIYKYLKEENSHNSLAWIGQEFGRDHATVIHGLREYEKYKQAVSKNNN